METENLDLEAIADKWLQQCGPCDGGLPMGCSHPGDDYRPVMASLVDEVVRLREDAGVWKGQVVGIRHQQVAAIRDAEQANIKLARVAKVRDKWAAYVFYEVAAMQLRNSFTRELDDAMGN